MTSLAEHTSVEVESSRLPHRELTNGALRPPSTEGGEEATHQCLRADLR